MFLSPPGQCWLNSAMLGITLTTSSAPFLSGFQGSGVLGIDPGSIASQARALHTVLSLQLLEHL